MEQIATNPTDEGEEDEMITLLKANNLYVKEVLEIFKQYKPQLSELKQFTEDELYEYGKDTLKLDVLSRKRFVKAILQSEPQSTTHIIVSKPEKEALTKLELSIKQTQALIKTETNNQNSLSNVKSINEAKINTFFDGLNKIILNRQKQLINDLNTEINNTTNKIQVNINNMNQYLKDLHKAKTTWNNIVMSQEMTDERETNIVNLTKNILIISESHQNILNKKQYKIEFTIDKQEIQEYITNIGCITNEKYPQTPVITLGDIGDTFIVIQNNMDIIDEKQINDNEIITQCVYEYAESNDEKKINWNKLEPFQNQKSFKCNKLKPETEYVFRCQFCNEYGKSKFSNIIGGTTKPMGLFKWDRDRHGSGLVFVSDERVQFLQNKWGCMAVADTIISCEKYETYSFTVKANKGSTNLMIGFVRAQPFGIKNWNNYFANGGNSKEDTFGVQVYSGGKIWCCGGEYGNIVAINKTHNLKEGDEIKWIFNFKDKNAIALINNKSFDIQFGNINFDIVPALSLYAGDVSVINCQGTIKK